MFQKFFRHPDPAGAASAPTRLSFDDFLRTPPGELLLEWEREAYAELTADVFGGSALQIGMPEMNTLAENRMKSRWLIEPRGAVRIADEVLADGIGRIVAAPELLPVADESMDLVTLPHALDLSAAPQQALREAVRILEPEGRLILTAFNALGLWWMRQQGMRLGAAPYLPTGLAPISLHRLKDWLGLLGLEIDRGRFGIYRPGFRSERRLASWRWLDKAGDRWLPQCSNIILLSAVKRVPGSRIIRCGDRPPQTHKVPAAGVPAASNGAPTIPRTTENSDR